MSLQAQQRDYAFCILARQNPFRRVVIAIVENPWFNRLVLSIIIANCIFLAIANPLCDTEVEIKSNPACAANPAKWQSVSPHTHAPKLPQLRAFLLVSVVICIFLANARPLHSIRLCTILLTVPR